MDKKLSEQIEKWHQSEEYQKIVDTILAVPENERDYDMLGQLAVAYNNLEQYEKAIDVLKNTKEEGKEHFKWYYRFGYAYYYLDRFDEAKDLFEKSLTLCDKDDDDYIEHIKYFIELCRSNIDKENEEIDSILDENILEQIKKWHNEDKHDKIISIVLSTPGTENDYYALGVLARAYNNIENYDKAKDILLQIKDKGENDSLWNFRLAYSYYYLQRYEEAKEYFEKTLLLNPKEPDAQYFLDSCVNILISKKYSKKFEEAKNKKDMPKQIDFTSMLSSIYSFKERAKSFWTWFEKNESKVADMTENREKYKSDEVVSFVSKGVDLIGKDIQFNIGGEHEFIFVVSGGKHLFYLLPYITQSIPLKFKDKWHFFPYMQSTRGENFGFEMNGKKLSMAEVLIHAEYDEKENMFNLGFYNKDIVDLEDNEIYNFFFTMMDITLGEGISNIYIGSIDKLDDVKDNMIPLTELEKYILDTLEKNEVNFITRFDERYSSYGFTPKVNDNLRYDIITGSISYMDILNCYYDNDRNTFDKISSFGAKAVFITYKHKANSMKKALNERFEITDAIENEILGEKGSGKENGIVLGGAIGTSCCYIDLLLYNEKYFLSNIGKVLEKYKVDFYISDFYLGADIIKL